MPKAIRIHKTGDASVLSYDDVEVPPPGRGEVLLRHTAIGVNYADINLRRGTFYLNNPLAMPAILGNEGVGVVEALGPDVTEVAVGDRVAYVTASGTTTSPGSYSEQRVIDAKLLAKIPASISNEQAAAAFVKGLTAWVIVRRMFPVLPGHSVLVHAAAGGVSTFLTQWSRHLGATVIGTVGSPEKAKIAQAAGCHHTILYREQDFVKETLKIVPDGVSAVFDGVGKDVFLQSLECLDPFGMLVNFGNASGPPPPVDVRLLAKKGAQTVTRIGMGYFFYKRDILVSATDELFQLIAAGALKTKIDRVLPLRDAAQAHRAIEERHTTGSVILVP